MPRTAIARRSLAIASVLVAAVVAAIAACRPASQGPAPLDDSTYTTVMADLMRVELTRRTRQLPPPPVAVPGRLSTDTAWKSQRTEDSVRNLRRDSLARADVLRRHGVTAAQLEATARALAQAPARARAVWDSVSKRANGPRPPS